MYTKVKWCAVPLLENIGTQFYAAGRMSMDAEGQEEINPGNPPGDSIIVRQSPWAWMWAAAPWLVLFGVSLVFDFLTFGIVPMVLATVIIIPRYIGFTKTVYILSEGQILVRQGSIIGNRESTVAFGDIGEVVQRSGMFGSSLGYKGVTLVFKEGGGVHLQYVPDSSKLIEFIQSRLST